MSIARHHNEWLSLIEISGPFLSLPVLMRTFPQGLDALDRDGMAELRLAYEEWLDDQNSLRPSPAIHSVWVRYVLEHVLGFEKSHLLEGPAIPATLQAFVAEQGETLRPDLVVSNSPLLPGEGLGVRLLVQICPMTQGLEKSMQNHRWKASPAMRMLELLRATGVSLGLVTNGEQWMLVNAPKGETSAFVSWYAALWLEEPLTLRAFSSLLGATRFFSVADEDTLEGMLKDSVNEQQEVTDQLGYQVRRAVEVLIRAIDKVDQDCGRTLLKDIPEKDLYEAALTVMMRLVFLFSAEERGLLLLGDPLYDQNYAVSTLRAQLRETADQQGEEVLERRFDAWCRLLATFRAVHDGIHHDRLNLPAYGGSLFDPERYPFLEGRIALIPNPSPERRRESPLPAASALRRELGEGKGEGPLPISNRTVLHLLEALQVLRVKVPGGGPAEARRLSFRALDVEQIGHVYEGLLDHIAVRATEPVLGLAGTREKEPEIPLSKLEAFIPSPSGTSYPKGRGQGEGLLAFLKEQTGRSENALRKALQERPDVFTNQHLLIACNNDAKMLERVAQYAGLLREDDFGYPAVFLPGSVYVTAGATRRATGTHYTPRSLTEPIVQHTLEPLVYTGPAEGLPKEEWKLKSPAELLELKVCDMAMGSAGFLVQVIRYLSERLVEAWDQISPEPFAKSQPSEMSGIPVEVPHPSPLPAGEGVAKEALSPEMLERVRELRKNATEAEAFLWELLRDRQLAGFKFRRQHPLGGTILDFYCHEVHLAVEIDDAVHKEPEQAQHDAERSAYLNEQGIRVIRFWNHEVLNQTDAVLKKILKEFQSSASPVLPSPSGRRAGDEGRFLRITPEGQPASGKPGELIIPADDEERLVLARRLVADRCIYGVDKNPLAVEIAKLSIWLTTLDKGRPFTFLDHALKCGDSLVGADEDMYRKWAYSLKGAQFTLYLTTLEEFTAAARQKRRELESFTVLDVRDAEHKAELLKEADAAMARVKLGCDLLVGVRLLGLKPAEQETLLSHLLWDYVAGLPMDTLDAQRALHAARKERAFHWPFEFPEVFAAEGRGGFSAFVGNPPFMGNRLWAESIGDYFQDWAKFLIVGNTGRADLCALFFYRAFFLLHKHGYAGLIGSDSLREGETREISLQVIAKAGNIYRAIQVLKWPGEANVHVCIVWFAKTKKNFSCFINNKPVDFIDDHLSDQGIEIVPPYSLTNELFGGKGSDNSRGEAFVLVDGDLWLKRLIQNNEPFCRQFLTADDLTTSGLLTINRWIVDTQSCDLYEVNSKSKLTFEFLMDRVKDVRTKEYLKAYPGLYDRWWQLWGPRTELYSKIRMHPHCIVMPVVSKYLMVLKVPSDWVFTNKFIIIEETRPDILLILSTSIADVWFRRYSGSLGQTMSVSISQAFSTFPLPKELIQASELTNMYIGFRNTFVETNKTGFTNFYNWLHNQREKSATEARGIIRDMDYIISSAYGWSDLDLGHGFHETPQGVRYTISEAARREVLARLLQLNHERYEEEVRQGLHEKDKKKAQKEEKSARQKPKKLAQPEGQMNLLAEPEVPEVTEDAETLSATPTAEIGSWDRCKCLACGKTMMGFSIAEHTQTVHQGKDPGYRKMGG